MIIGATGTDALRGVPTERLNGHKIFISASSSDVELRYLLDLVGARAGDIDPYQNVTAMINPRFAVTILNGGAPINFDRQKAVEDPRDMELTRMLMYAGAYEAVTGNSKESGIKELSEAITHAVFDLWKEGKQVAHPL